VLQHEKVEPRPWCRQIKILDQQHQIPPHD
jgi:hypothetical protein